MTEGEYQGWSNRLTWLFFVHIQNNQYLLLRCRELAGSVDNKYRLADELEDLLEGVIAEWIDTVPDIKGKGMFGSSIWNSKIGALVYDLINHGVMDVKWSELAEYYLEQV